ncbi:dolichyl-diphosphooligosaccharide--protein glycosyltransferase subunit 1 [Xylographa bjoerkii]|nr:dolichyl-diphosphooligosaccharide--protein glycosyltransferase subunit 1 [Xylographa bjoerkii]
MRLSTFSVACFTILQSTYAAESNLTTPLSSHLILPTNFKPPQVFKNANLVRSVNLEKGYVKETVNVVIENIDTKPQDEYYVPFDGSVVGKVGGFEVWDKKDTTKSAFRSELVEYDTYRSIHSGNRKRRMLTLSSPTQFYRVTLPEPLSPSAQLTLSITYHLLSSLSPLPATIKQQDKQYLKLTLSIYAPSAYLTQKQKTKIKFPGVDIPEYTGEPERQGSTFTYGPYDNIPAGSESPASVRYEFTKPIIHATSLERDIEISHWGGNLATEERYQLTNKGASLSNHFSRVTWQSTQYYNPPVTAIKALNVPLKIGSLNPYFIDDIGNVSTSRYRSNLREANLELKPRYPIFGGWSFPFRIGWDANLNNFLRNIKGDQYTLKVPFLEGPKMGEGISYEKITLRVILPEGATNVKYHTSVQVVTESISQHRTFMDTLGRTTLTLTAMNVIDESRDADLFVTYEYPMTAGLRKPITIFLGVMAVFTTAWVVGRVDTSIGKKS